MRAGRLALLTVAMAYMLLLAFPSILFAHHLDHGNFHVYAETPIDPDIIPVLDEAAALLARSSLNDPGMEHRLYLCSSRFKMKLLAPFTRAAFGETYSVLVRRNTILSRTDIRANLIFRDAPSRNQRPLSAVIAHERVHALMGRRYGDLTCLRLPAWKTEGYCESIAGSPSFDVAEGKHLIREGKVEASGPFRYFRYGLMVKYLMDVEGLSIDEVVAREFDPDQLLAKVRKNIDKL